MMGQKLDERGLPPGYPFDPAWEVTPRETRRMMEEEGAALIDCRRHDEWAAERIEGAVHVPLDEMAGRVEELRKYEGRPVVVHCRSGRRSLTATEILRKAGFENVRSMAGGIELWKVDR